MASISPIDCAPAATAGPSESDIQLKRIADTLERLLGLCAEGFARDIESQAQRRADEVRRMAETPK